MSCVDGSLVRIKQPSGVDNPRAYYSDHYCAMGLNVQAVCDERLRFSFIAVAGAGRYYRYVKLSRRRRLFLKTISRCGYERPPPNITWVNGGYLSPA